MYERLAVMSQQEKRRWDHKLIESSGRKRERSAAQLMRCFRVPKSQKGRGGYIGYEDLGGPCLGQQLRAKW